jgi:TATA-binding protein-associated factor
MNFFYSLFWPGTPVQNHVNEVWATFDFLMPNFLGTEASFLKEFARPITRSQAPDASAPDIDDGLDSLKILHQQVLPFILRREKMQVMNELPPKTITDIPCQLSKEQILLYEDILKASGIQDALEQVENALLEEGVSNGAVPKIGSDILKSLLQLRLICTHPLLHMASHKSDSVRSFSRLDCSGKLVALNDLLRHSGIAESEMYAADNDDSGFMLPDENFDGDYDIMDDHETAQCGDNAQRIASKCLIFAQFTQSLDIVEEYLFEPHIPSLQYLRLDGKVPPDTRHSIVEQFNTDDNIKVLLLTTKVGGLGLNLTGADKVIFLEPDWNPFIDLQAQDRAHRIGQTKAVNIYRLITSNTIEEKMMRIQQRKKAVSDAVVNSENSTMYSMGTEKLLDIFTFRGTTSTSDKNGDEDNLLSYLDEGTNEYASSLSVDAFLGALS